MPNEAEDVQPDSSTAPEVVADPQPDPEPVPDSDAVPGRTIDNVRAEFDRKHRETKATLDQILAVLTAAPRPQAPPEQPRGWDQYDDAQLAQLAQSGSTDALQALTQRHAAREVEQRTAAQRQIDVVQVQLAGLYRKYPQLVDASHPLTQAALRAKMILTQSGKPNTQATDVEAIMLAIADNPGLAVAPQPTSPTPRRDAPHATVDGVTPRRSPSARPAPKVDPKVAEIARRMGVDPVKAMERHRARQAAGQSAVSPQVAMIVREQGEN